MHGSGFTESSRDSSMCCDFDLGSGSRASRRRKGQRTYPHRTRNPASSPASLTPRPTLSRARASTIWPRCRPRRWSSAATSPARACTAPSAGCPASCSRPSNSRQCCRSPPSPSGAAYSTLSLGGWPSASHRRGMFVMNSVPPGCRCVKSAPAGAVNIDRAELDSSPPKVYFTRTVKMASRVKEEERAISPKAVVDALKEMLPGFRIIPEQGSAPGVWPLRLLPPAGRRTYRDPGRLPIGRRTALSRSGYHDAHAGGTGDQAPGLSGRRGPVHRDRGSAPPVAKPASATWTSQATPSFGSIASSSIAGAPSGLPGAGAPQTALRPPIVPPRPGAPRAPRHGLDAHSTRRRGRGQPSHGAPRRQRPGGEGIRRKGAWRHPPPATRSPARSRLNSTRPGIARAPSMTFVRNPAQVATQLSAAAREAGMQVALTLHSGAAFVAPFVRSADVHAYVADDPERAGPGARSPP